MGSTHAHGAVTPISWAKFDLNIEVVAIHLRSPCLTHPWVPFLVFLSSLRIVVLRAARSISRGIEKFATRSCFKGRGRGERGDSLVDSIVTVVRTDQKVRTSRSVVALSATSFHLSSPFPRIQNACTAL